MTNWTMKDVQIQLHTILTADHPLTHDQRRALKAVIEMCDLWNKMSGGFQKLIQEYRDKGLLPTKPKDSEG